MNVEATVNPGRCAWLRAGRVWVSCPSPLAHPLLKDSGLPEATGSRGNLGTSSCYGNWLVGRSAACQWGTWPEAPHPVLEPSLPPVARNYDLHRTPSWSSGRCKPLYPDAGCFAYIRISVPIHGNANTTVDPQHPLPLRALPTPWGILQLGTTGG